MDHSARRTVALEAAVAQGLLDEDYPLIGLLDARTIRENVAALTAAFAGEHEARHLVAAKSVTLVPILRLLADAGLGCEVASPGELAMATAAGFAHDDIVYDSPAKTRSELEEVLRRGINLNIDNRQELARVDEVIAGIKPIGHIGLRINPQRGAGRIEAMSTASVTSKFGFALRDDGARDEIVEFYAERPWMTQLHVHSGSQGLTLEQMALGVRDVVELADDIDARAGRSQIHRIDIGGGLPVNFDDDEVRPTFADYRLALDEYVPGLFDGRRTILTEFGRALTAKAGTIVSQVEYTKTSGGRRIAIAHAGAQVAARTVMSQGDWPVRVTVHAPDGTPRNGAVQTQDIAGPCCFAGDVLAKGVDLPLAEEGDLIAVHDTGAYYVSAHYAYNALPRPAVHLYETDDAGDVVFRTVRRRQGIDELLAEAAADLS